MDNLGRIAILEDENNTYYYYQLTEEKIIRVTDNLKSTFHDFRVDSNATWTTSILEDDLEREDLEIVFLDLEIATFIVDEMEEVANKKITKYLLKQCKGE